MSASTHWLDGRTDGLVNKTEDKSLLHSWKRMLVRIVLLGVNTCVILVSEYRCMLHLKQKFHSHSFPRFAFFPPPMLPFSSSHRCHYGGRRISSVRLWRPRCFQGGAQRPLLLQYSHTALDSADDRRRVSASQVGPALAAWVGLAMTTPGKRFSAGQAAQQQCEQQCMQA